ncbi:hypothetical protein SG0102_23270 [Intestinibaculum porci]|uniref:Uncharacterized protein n=2 Tax=Intestinibaculum porci TaxID=2487118 RepID=A0A3G9JQX5_9FIRM|nr:hypothetical protein SG0102_23270 [Intestinibaculum porci]
MNKQLILIVQTENNYFPLDYQYADICNIFKSENKIFRYIRKIILKLDLPIKNIIFTDWIKKIAGSKEVIVFDTGNAVEIVKYINKRYPNKRIILWYWNPVIRTIKPEKFKGLNCEMWTFDPVDAKKFNMKLNTQFFIEENLKTTSSKVKSRSNCDVFYVGVDKDRAKLLAVLKKQFDENKISYDFNLVEYNNSGLHSNKYDIPYKKPLSYEEVKEKCASSKVIVDLVADGQTGLTLRPLEALCLKKKLITNMKSIKKYDFYNPQNIFIIGEDKENRLSEFVSSNYDETNYDIYKNEYSFKQWLERFDKNENIS